jgi:undecaprenyl-diphosphatase
LRGEMDARMGWYVIIGTVPIGVLGYLFADTIETTFRNLYLTGTVLVVFALILGAADRAASTSKPLGQLNIRDGILYGFAQALALIPGVSRSGGTITGGLLLGYTRAAAARYSFLLAIPAVYASGFFQIFRLAEADPNPAWPQIIVATLVAGVIGYAVIAYFLRYISDSRHSFMPFVIYRVVLGSVVLVLAGAGVLDPNA